MHNSIHKKRKRSCRECSLNYVSRLFRGGISRSGDSMIRVTGGMAMSESVGLLMEPPSQAHAESKIQDFPDGQTIKRLIDEK